MSITHLAQSGLPLGIYIPAFKGAFLRKTLGSICAQSDQRFNLYIGDDASPESLAEIVDEFQRLRPLKYRRFEKHLGTVSLVKHWSRCLAMGDEPWVWLFSDDDIMDRQCVEQFFKVRDLTKEGFDVYRFNHGIIDATGKALRDATPPHPETETSLDFAWSQLEEKRFGFLQELVMSRRRLGQIGGFVEFPLAWASDNATLMKVAGQIGIRNIPGPLVYWRFSGVNITSIRSNRYACQKATAASLYAKWLLDNLTSLAPNYDDATHRAMLLASEKWYRNQVCQLSKIWDPGQIWKMSCFLSQTWGVDRYQSIKWLLALNWNRIERAVIALFTRR